jgi:hypothetical protein
VRRAFRPNPATISVWLRPQPVNSPPYRSYVFFLLMRGRNNVLPVAVRRCTSTSEVERLATGHLLVLTTESALVRDPDRPGRTGPIAAPNVQSPVILEPWAML